MPDTFRSLAQTLPDAATLTDLYVASAPTVVSSVVICNTTAVEQTVRLAHAIGGAADGLPQYLYYDLPIASKDTFTATLGITLAAADVLRGYTSATGVTFQVYGVTVTA